MNLRTPEVSADASGVLFCLPLEFFLRLWYNIQALRKVRRTAPAAWFGIRMRVLYDGAAVNQVRWGTKQP